MDFDPLAVTHWGLEPGAEKWSVRFPCRRTRNGQVEFLAVYEGMPGFAMTRIKGDPTLFGWDVILDPWPYPTEPLLLTGAPDQAVALWQAGFFPIAAVPEAAAWRPGFEIAFQRWSEVICLVEPGADHLRAAAAALPQARTVTFDCMPSEYLAQMGVDGLAQALGLLKPPAKPAV